jgi:hypothetical protein
LDTESGIEWIHLPKSQAEAHSDWMAINQQSYQVIVDTDDTAVLVSTTESFEF